MLLKSFKMENLTTTFITSNISRQSMDTIKKLMIRKSKKIFQKNVQILLNTKTKQSRSIVLLEYLDNK